MKIQIVHTCSAQVPVPVHSSIAQSVTARLAELGKLPAEYSVIETGYAEIDKLLYLPDSRFSDPESIERFDAVDVFIFTGSKPLANLCDSLLSAVGLLMSQCVQFSRCIAAFGSAYTHLALVLSTGGQFYEWGLQNGGLLEDLQEGELEAASGNVLLHGGHRANVGTCRWDSQTSIHSVDGPQYQDTIMSHGSYDVMHNCLPTSAAMVNIASESLFRNCCRWTALGTVLTPRIPTFKVLSRCNKTGIVAFQAGRATAAQFVPDEGGSPSEKLCLQNILRIACSQLSHLAGVGVSSKNLLLAQNTVQPAGETQLHTTILPAPVTLSNASSALVHDRETEFSGSRLAGNNTISEARQDSKRKVGGGYVDAVATDLASAACISRATTNAEVLVFPAYAFSSVSMQQHPLLRSLQFNKRFHGAATGGHETDLPRDDHAALRLAASAQRARRAAAMLAASAGKHISLKSRKTHRVQDSAAKLATQGLGSVQGSSEYGLSSLDLTRLTRSLPTALASITQKSTSRSEWLKSATAMTEERLRNVAAQQVRRRPSHSIDSTRVQRQNFFRAKQTTTVEIKGKHKCIGNVGRGYELGSTVEPSAVLAMVRPTARIGLRSLERVDTVGKLANFGNANGAFDCSVGDVLSMATDASCTAECFSRQNPLPPPLYYAFGTSPPRQGRRAGLRSSQMKAAGTNPIRDEAPMNVSMGAAAAGSLYASLEQAFSSKAPLRSLQQALPGQHSNPVTSPIQQPKPTKVAAPKLSQSKLVNEPINDIEYSFKIEEDTPFTQSVRSIPENEPVQSRAHTMDGLRRPVLAPKLNAHQHRGRGPGFRAVFKSSSCTASDAHPGGGLQQEPYCPAKNTFREEARGKWQEPLAASKSGFVFGATHTRSFRPGRTATGYKLGDELRTYDPGHSVPVPMPAS